MEKHEHVKQIGYLKNRGIWFPPHVDSVFDQSHYRLKTYIIHSNTQRQEGNYLGSCCVELHSKPGDKS